jgi:phosphatidylinositol-3-phosphatase
MRAIPAILLLTLLGLAGFAGAARVAGAETHLHHRCRHHRRPCRHRRCRHHRHHVCRHHRRRHQTTTTSTTTTGGGRSPYTHVVWIVMENHSYSQIVGNKDAPYINQLATTYGSATNMLAEGHPSLPNYIAMTSGSSQGITDDGGPSSHPLSVASIFSELGTHARSLEDSMPSTCNKSDSGEYAVRHDPEVYYTNLGTACSTNDVPLGSTPDLSAEFTFITPNLIDDMHDGTIAQGDQWLSTFMPKVFATPQYRAGNTVVFLTWDEDDGSTPNHIVTIVISPTSKGISSSTAFTHYSMLRTTEEILGLPLLGAAQNANSMLATFKLG